MANLLEHKGFWVIVIIMIWVVIGSLAYVFYFTNSNNTINSDDLNDSNTSLEKTTCIDLGCSETTNFVGSANSDKYYPCDCRFAKTVNPENIVCFQSEQVAEIKGYTRSDC